MCRRETERRADGQSEAERGRSSARLRKDAERRILHDGKNALEDHQAHEKTGHGKLLPANPVEITLRADPRS